TLLILTAFFHDIGMAPDEKEVLAWKKVWDKNPETKDEEEAAALKQFARYYSARREQSKLIQDHISNGENSKASLLQDYLVTDFIRSTHADRARKIIQKHYEDKIKYRDVDLSVEFAALCYSHNEDPAKLLELDKNYLCGPD